MKSSVWLLAFIWSLCACSMVTPKCNKLSALYDDPEYPWYSKHYRAAKTKPLCLHRSANYETFRLVILRSFHNPIFIDIEKSGTRIEINAVRLDGYGGYAPGKPVEYKNIRLSGKEFEYFKSKLHSADFWHQKTSNEIAEDFIIFDGEIIEEVIITDGATWIFEGATHEKKHIFDRHSDYDDALWDAGLFLIEKSGIDTNGDIY